MIASARFFYLIIIANTRLLALALPSIISFLLWKLFAITAFMGSGNKGYGLLGLKSDVVAFTEASQNGDTERREDVLCMAFVMYFYPVLLTASAAALLRASIVLVTNVFYHAGYRICYLKSRINFVQKNMCLSDCDGLQ